MSPESAEAGPTADDLPREVHIDYRRPPDRKDVFHQWLVYEDDGVKVTYADDLTFDEPVTVDGSVVLEAGSEVVWFTFPGAWHDIGRFHTADGTFRGLYANILTPPTFHEGDVWRTTDLFLDVWLPAGGGDPEVLDRDQLEEAAHRGWVDERLRARAEEEAASLLESYARGSWPPPVVQSWTLVRARDAVGGRSRGQTSASPSTPYAAQSRSTST